MKAMKPGVGLPGRKGLKYSREVIVDEGEKSSVNI